VTEPSANPPEGSLVNLELSLMKDGDGRQILRPDPDRYKFVSVLRLS
jgi:hypothetical protein